MQAKLTKVGNSIGFMIPSPLRRSLKLEAGQKVTIEETEDGLLMRRALRPSYSLEELLSLCDPNAPMPSALKEWDDSAPVGNEAW